MLKEIVTAIESKSLLLFDYNEKPRVVEPHAVGYTKDHNLVLRAFQTGGDGSGWKLFSLAEVGGLTTKIAFEFDNPRPGYKPGDSVMLHVIAELRGEAA